MDKEEALERIVATFFKEIFEMGRSTGASADRETLRRVEFLNRQYLTQKKRDFTKELKKAGILQLDK